MWTPKPFMSWDGQCLTLRFEGGQANQSEVDDLLSFDSSPEHPDLRRLWDAREQITAAREQLIAWEGEVEALQRDLDTLEPSQLPRIPDLQAKIASKQSAINTARQVEQRAIEVFISIKPKAKAAVQDFFRQAQQDRLAELREECQGLLSKVVGRDSQQTMDRLVVLLAALNFLSDSRWAGNEASRFLGADHAYIKPMRSTMKPGIKKDEERTVLHSKVVEEERHHCTRDGCGLDLFRQYDLMARTEEWSCPVHGPVSIEMAEA